MNTKELCYDIVAGPSKDRLFDACKYVFDKNCKITLDFAVAKGYTMPKGDPGCAYIPMNLFDFKIHKIEHEDGSGESFNLEGYCKDPNTPGRARYFSAYYNTKRRTGTISFEQA